MTDMPSSLLDRSGLVIVDKPAGLSSHDVVARVRRAFHTRAVGHAGTLDPMATGVLVLGVERGTKFLAHLVHATKTYEAIIRLGSATTTDDAEGEEISRASAAELAEVSVETINAAIGPFRGDIMQRPARVSAVKIDGKRAYQRVRDGEDIEIPARPVTIFSYSVSDIRPHSDHIDVDIRVQCSSGTYIRSLARDLGEALGIGGHLIYLRRTVLGHFSLEDAQTLEELEKAPQLSMSLDQALPHCYPVLDITADQARDLSMGKWLQPVAQEGPFAAVDPDGRAIALVKQQGKRLASIFVARPNTLN
ncbi:tRNA pseudouridine(55) synthase TruB [Corynebacterium sp. ES2775-CONJ]|nr:tRNA pseudouridine(55) synthase TruB [Corynebacterium sp. ES2775-CONJ]MCS4489129.1 tRNA pseudouridine(55) synthase TruB [Corynebacterium sp. ES2775-CONJ]